MKKILIFPTWVLVRLMTPILPKTHELSGKTITLHDWAKNATYVNYVIAMIFWFEPINIYLALNLISKH